MNAVSVFVATATLLLQGGDAAPSGAYYGAGHGVGYGTGGYGAASHGAYNRPRYHGPQAIPVVLPDGHIADTHEVAAAKGAHFAAVAKAQATSHAAEYNSGHDGSYAGGYGGYSAGSHGAGYGGLNIRVGYNGGHGAGSYGAGHYGGATYVGRHGGHNAEYSGASYVGGYGGYAAGGYGAGYGGVGYGLNTPYYRPIAKPIVLPSGYLADTYDVTANKAAHLNALSHAAHSHSGWAPHGSHSYH